MPQQGCAGSKGSDRISIKAAHSESGVKCLAHQPLLSAKHSLIGLVADTPEE